MGIFEPDVGGLQLRRLPVHEPSGSVPGPLVLRVPLLPGEREGRHWIGVQAVDDVQLGADGGRDLRGNPDRSVRLLGAVQGGQHPSRQAISGAFAVPDHQDRAVGVMDDALGGATEQRSRDAAESPAAHDHEAGPDLLGHAHDLRVGTPYPRVGARHLAQAADLHRLFVEPHFRLATGPLARLREKVPGVVECGRHYRVVVRQRLDVDDVQRGVESLREPDSHPRRAGGIRRAVGSQEHLCREHGSSPLRRFRAWPLAAFRVREHACGPRPDHRFEAPGLSGPDPAFFPDRRQASQTLRPCCEDEGTRPTPAVSRTPQSGTPS